MWRDCIVTMIDLVGTKEQARDRSSRVMRSLHKLVVQSRPDLRFVRKIYTWNDSVLLLSFVGAHATSYAAAMRDAYLMKQRVDQLQSCYTVAVKGQAFPPPAEHDADVTFIAASSWAMANCFEIVERLKTVAKAWYIDSRIANKISPGRVFQKTMLPLLPSRKSRSICLCDEYPWPLDRSKGG